jgi:regulator of protease activity HflC (stomatin/prohibitin superfamily)
VAEFLRLLLDAIQYIWPFRMVRTGEVGVFFVLGRARRMVAPGVYPVLWWFMDVRAVPVKRDNYETLLQTITLKNEDTLTFNATVSFIITNSMLALTEVQRYDETATEDAAAVLADTLADLDVGRLDPAKRRGLLRTCTAAVNAVVEPYGVHVESLRFNNFVHNIKTYRLFGVDLNGS